MGAPAITLHVDPASRTDATDESIVLDDPEVLRFLLSQPDPRAALRDSISRGVQSLRLATAPWPDRADGEYRIVGAAT